MCVYRDKIGEAGRVDTKAQSEDDHLRIRVCVKISVGERKNSTL